MGLHLDERADGGFALYIDGDFQFDTADEAVYHESLALPALCLTRPEDPSAIRVLICGGGDGLALRECLRYPGVASVDLVDYDQTIVDLARSRFAEVNRQAFDDPRVRVHFRDAWEFVESIEGSSEFGPSRYDVILCDFTVPRTPDHTRIFTREWYAALKKVLTPGGIMALNAVSPQTAPEAFWCLRRTVRSAGLSSLPYRVCIPSFRAHGYGAWGFILAAKRRLTADDLRFLECAVPTRQADISQLWRGARFRRAERQIERQAPIQSLDNNCLLPLLLNPGSLQQADAAPEDEPYSLEPLLRAIPITHAYHTRVMIETLAEQVVSTVEQIDIERLVEALLRRAARLPNAIREELLRLRDFLADTTFRWERVVAWGTRLFAALVILMTLANAIAPDNAFAKGSAGLGHSGVSRGFSSNFSRSGSFGGSSTGRTGSFGSSGGRGSFGRSGAFASHGLFSRSAAAPIMRGSGFRSGYGNGHVVDMYGESYPVHTFHYYYGGTRSYFSPNQNAPVPGPQQEHRPLFAADDDLLVMDNGDIVVTLSDRAYLLVAEGKVVLRSDQSPESLVALYPDPAFFQTIAGQIRERQAGVQQAIVARRDWLSWVGWTSALLPAIAQDKTELSHLQDLDKRLSAAIERMGDAPGGATPLPPPATGEVELFVDTRYKEPGVIAMRQSDGAWLLTDGQSIFPENGSPNVHSVPAPPALAVALKSVVTKLRKEMTGDVASLSNDIAQLQKDRASLDHDLAEYTGLQAANDPGYQVDYGSEEISVSDAISRTQKDIDQNIQETAQTLKERDKTIADLARLAAAPQALRQ